MHAAQHLLIWVAKVSHKKTKQHSMTYMKLEASSCWSAEEAEEFYAVSVSTLRPCVCVTEETGDYYAVGVCR